MVFPQSNLPGEAVQWGRALQSAVEQTRSSVETLRQDFLSNNRSLAGQLGVVGRQIEELSLQQQELESQQNSLVLLFNSLPRNDGAQQRDTGWSVDTAPTTGAWTTVSSASISVPDGVNRAAVTSWGSASATSSNVYESAMQARIVVSGTGSSPFEGMMETLASTVRCTVNASYFREFSVSPGDSVAVQLQVRGRYSGFPASNVSNLTVSVGFTRVGF